MAALRKAVPAVSVGISTGLWIAGSPEARLKEVSGWSELPDFVSINFDEQGAAELAGYLLERGVGIEVGISSSAAAEALLDSHLVQRCLRVLLEPAEQDLVLAFGTLSEISEVLKQVQGVPPILLHGVDATAWELFRYAMTNGYRTRVGMEDMLHLPDGKMAFRNAEIVKAALAMTRTGRRLNRSSSSSEHA